MGSMSEQPGMWARRNTYVDKIIMKKCYKCNSVKPPHAHHCANCGNCVAYMDHHCPWVNNCVGLYTQKLFVLFNFYTLLGNYYSPLTLLAIIYALTINLYYGLAKLRQYKGGEKMQMEDFWQALCIFECVAFGLFIIVVFFDQVAIILNRLTVIDRVKLQDNRL